MDLAVDMESAEYGAAPFATLEGVQRVAAMFERFEASPGLEQRHQGVVLAYQHQRRRS